MNLKDLITSNTKIIHLEKSSYANIDEKIKILGWNSNLKINMIHKIDNEFYFYKELFEFYCMINELIGVYLANFFSLPTIKYQIGEKNNEYSLLSKNFKEKNKDYYFINNINIVGLQTHIDTLDNIYLLKQLCINEDNSNNFIDRLLKLFSLDIYSNQADRVSSNLMFEQDKKTREFNLSTIYDYEYSFSEGNYFKNRNPIIDLNMKKTIPLLLNKYPQFYEILKTSLDINLEKIIKQIFEKYYFNKQYEEKVINFYKKQEERQKEKIYKILL